MPNYKFLFQISNVLYTNKSMQVIKKNLNVRNIVVIGNVIIKKTVNGISLEDLKNLVTISDRQIISSDVMIDANLIAGQLNLSNINQQNLVFIMQDAVRHSVPQVSFNEFFENKIFKLFKFTNVKILRYKLQLETYNARRTYSASIFQSYQNNVRKFILFIQ